MKKFIITIILVLTLVSQASATWLRVPVIGRGIDEPETSDLVGSWRPKTPVGIKGWSGTPIKDGSGVVQHFIIWVNEAAGSLSLGPGQVVLPRDAALTAIGARGDTNQMERLPPPAPLREAVGRFWNKVADYIGPAIAWAATASDAFTGTGALSGNWTSGPISSAAPVRASDVAQSGAGSDLESSAHYNAISPGADQYSQFTVDSWNRAGAGGAGEFLWLLLRASNSSETYYRCDVRNDNEVLIRSDENGADFTTHAQATSAVVATDVMRCEITGSNITFKKNGGQILTASDSAIASGFVGFGMKWASGFGGSAADAEVDDWEGGDLPSKLRRRGVTIIQ